MGFAALVVVQVEFDRATTTCFGRDHGLDATGIEHTGGGAVDVGAHAGLHATGQHQYTARMGARGQAPALRASGTLALRLLGNKARTLWPSFLKAMVL
jgi:hypothetical protein